MSNKPSRGPYKPWHPVQSDPVIATAVQALARGEADPAQQKEALEWIIEVAAMTHDQSFFPGGEEGRRDSDFAAGRRFVGLAIIKHTKLNASELARILKEERKHVQT